MIEERPGWQASAACRDVDLSVFFPDGPMADLTRKRRPTRRSDLAVVAAPAAVAICLACPVRDPCLTYALSRSLAGVWAATGPQERRDIRRDRGLPEPDDDTSNREEPAA